MKTIDKAPQQIGSPGDQLQSWKEIAAFIGRDERTAMRWAKEQGMPIRRVPGGTRGRVYGSRAEISAWLASAPGTIAVPRMRFSRKVLFAVATAACILIALAGVGLLHARMPSVPVRVEFGGDSIRALGADGRVLWTHRFPSQLDFARVGGPDYGIRIEDFVRIADLLGDGRREVLVVAPLRAGPNPIDGDRIEIDCFSAAGKLLWSYVPHEQFQFGPNVVSGPRIVMDVRVSPRGQGASIYAALGVGDWGNSYVVQIDPSSGKGAVRFVNTGTSHLLNELRTANANYLLVGGFNNEWDGGSLALIDERKTFAASPQTVGTRHKCLSCPPGDPDYYLVFPRSELNRARKVYESFVRGLAVTGGQIEVHANQVDDGHSEPVYRLQTAPAFQVLSLRFTSTYEIAHQQLGHSLADCPERLHPQPVRLWTSAQGWKDLPVPPVQ